MANPATTDDVESRWRPLLDSEYAVVTTRLDDAWRKLRRLVPDLEDRMIGDVDLSDEAVQVLADAVIRLMENPRGHIKGSIAVDDASTTWELADAYARDDLFFTDAELDSLRGEVTDDSPRAFSLMPS